MPPSTEEKPVTLTKTEIAIVVVDYASPAHATALVTLLDHYARGGSGGGQALAHDVKARLVPALARYSNALSLLAYAGDTPIGLVNAFETLSSFRALPLLNIHDIVVHEQWRGRGIATALMQALEQHARARGCCKLTLEVLEGNVGAQQLYRAQGFAGYSLKEEFGQALFWQKNLD